MDPNNKPQTKEAQLTQILPKFLGWFKEEFSGMYEDLENQLKSAGEIEGEENGTMEDWVKAQDPAVLFERIQFVMEQLVHRILVMTRDLQMEPDFKDTKDYQLYFMSQHQFLDEVCALSSADHTTLNPLVVDMVKANAEFVLSLAKELAGYAMEPDVPPPPHNTSAETVDNYLKAHENTQNALYLLFRWIKCFWTLCVKAEPTNA